MNDGYVYITMALVESFFEKKGWAQQPFQKEATKAFRDGKHGVVNAPTGSGKTYSLAIPILERIANNKTKGLKAIWITPIRALALEIESSIEKAIGLLDLPIRVARRTGDTSSSQRQKIKRNPPDILVTTPETLHLLLASKGYDKYFKNLQAIVIDEWHELIGTKRGVQIELALSRLKKISPLQVWGISATIGNLDEAIAVLLGNDIGDADTHIIKSKIEKEIEICSILPDDVKEMPWTGHLGVKLIKKVIPIIKKSTTTLLFTNTRAQAEIWYQRLIDVAPDLVGLVAIHHGSLSQEMRNWVEGALHKEELKAVVCTSSLDLGVDFRPVETIIQIGGAKGVSRFIQRAGRSGHRPGEKSKIYFLPTHSLELIEAAALRKAARNKQLEARDPYFRSFDVLIQYLVTLAVSDGFYPTDIFDEVNTTFCYESITRSEFQWCLDFITIGGSSLQSYDEYKKVEIEEDGLFKVNNRSIAMRHRLNIGTITSDGLLIVKYQKGKRLGSIEEWFVSKLKPGSVFWYAGRSLELIRVKHMVVIVQNSKKKTKVIPSFMGGRMPLTSQLGKALRLEMESYHSDEQELEIRFLKPLLDIQSERSFVPKPNEFLIEYFETKEGHHLVMFPFEGRFVHEGMAALLAYRIGQMLPISFSLAYNDYGFELVSDQYVEIEEYITPDLFSTTDLLAAIQSSVNQVEMARRTFRDIACISGMIFKGFPGKEKKDRHLQASSQLLFDVFQDYEPDNLLYLQAYQEVLDFKLEESRLRLALERIINSDIIITRPPKPTPFAFPLITDRLNREKMSTESLEDRIRKMLR